MCTIVTRDAARVRGFVYKTMSPWHSPRVRAIHASTTLFVIDMFSRFKLQNQGNRRPRGQHPDLPEHNQPYVQELVVVKHAQLRIL